MGIVTRIGDRGTTRTLAGEEISKADERLEYAGAIDEANASVGLARSLLKQEGLLNLAAEIRQAQMVLFRLGAEVSMGPQRVPDDAVDVNDVRHVEHLIGQYEHEARLPPSFLVPGTTPAASALDVARTQVRRLERILAAATEQGRFSNPQATVWINRLSDYLFLLARIAEQHTGVEFDTANKPTQ